MTIHYQIKAENPNAHLFSVEMRFNHTDTSNLILSLPNWIPGSYMIRDFSRNILGLKANCNGEAAMLKKLDKSQWQLDAIKGTVEVYYQVYAWDLSVRAAHLDNSHGFFNGTSVFLGIEGRHDEDVTVHILPPEGEQFAQWKLASSLLPIEINSNRFGSFKAADYDELLDHPVEMGTFTSLEFEACGVPHEVVLTGLFDADLERICSDLKTICEYHIRFFGEPAPMDRYVFLVMVVGDGYGGLEHRASTSLLVSRKHLPAIGATEISDDYLEFLGLCSHEYFHTWNVKRIKPAVFVPYQLQKESYTSLLWAFEGITSYYDDLSLVRCGLINSDRYLTLIGKTITRVYRGAGRLKQSVGDSSFDAWTKFYKQDENAPNAIVSYYAKGAIVALGLDCIMRQRSNNQLSLDDLMYRLWDLWLESGEGLEELAIERLAAELLGESLDNFFDQAVRGTDDLDLPGLLEYVGVEICWRQAVSSSDAGGDYQKITVSPLWCGMRYKDHAKGFEITHVLENGPALAAGLSAGDTVVAVDNYDSSQAKMDAMIKRKCANDVVKVHYFRHGELRETELTLENAPSDTCYLKPKETASDAMASWLAPVAREKS